jgi:hypothetical protein
LARALKYFIQFSAALRDAFLISNDLKSNIQVGQQDMCLDWIDLDGLALDQSMQ